MPYTFVHPGFTLPFKKFKPGLFSTSGLVFGSFAPDYDIILRFSNQRFHIFQYTLSDIFFLILPMAVVSAIYFNLLIKDILIEYAPQPFQSKFSKQSAAGTSSISFISSIRLITSVLFAIIIHLFLDLISHYDAYYFKMNALVYYQSLIAGEVAYFAAMYLPPLILSVIGLYLIIKALQDASIKLPSIRLCLSDSKTRIFLIVFSVFVVLFAGIKLLLNGIEDKFIIDSFIISLTSGILLSFFVTPTIFAIIKRFNQVSGQI